MGSVADRGANSLMTEKHNVASELAGCLISPHLQCFRLFVALVSIESSVDIGIDRNNPMRFQRELK